MERPLLKFPNLSSEQELCDWLEWNFENLDYSLLPYDREAMRDLVHRHRVDRRRNQKRKLSPVPVMFRQSAYPMSSAVKGCGGWHS